MFSLRYILLVMLLPMITGFTATVAYTTVTSNLSIMNFHSSGQSTFDYSDLSHNHKSAQGAINSTIWGGPNSHEENLLQKVSENEEIDAGHRAEAREMVMILEAVAKRKAARRERKTQNEPYLLPLPPTILSNLPRKQRNNHEVDTLKQADSRSEKTNLSTGDSKPRRPVFVSKPKNQNLDLAKYSLEIDQIPELAKEASIESTLSEEAKSEQAKIPQDKQQPVTPSPETVPPEDSTLGSTPALEKSPQSTPPWEAPKKRRHTLKELRDQYIVKQKLDYSCGAAVLATLMTYYFGDKTSEKEILELLTKQLEGLTEEQWAHKKRIGFSLLDLRNVAQQKGYQSAGFTLTIEQLRQLSAPVIVYVRPLDYHHFAVLRGVAGNRVFLADPSRGNLTMSTGRFMKEWDGTIFVLGKAGEEDLSTYPLALNRPRDYPHQRLRMLSKVGERATGLTFDSALRLRP